MSDSGESDDLEVPQDGQAPASPVYGNGSGINATPSVKSKSRSKRSLHLRHGTNPASTRPIDKFRSTVSKVMAMKRSTTILSSFGAGAEPGIDPRRASMEVQYRNVHQDCFIEVVDYSATNCNFTNMRNAEFVDWCANPKTKRQHWVKVRWINIAGISWDVIKAVSLRHDLHPLALEDVLSLREDNLSKADYFTQHLFLRILCHEVVDESSPNTVPPTFTDEPGKEDTDNTIRQRRIEEAKLDALKQGTLRVNVSPMFIFLFRSGLVITITQSTSPQMTLPIALRLRRADTILRSSSDPSMLVQSLLQSRLPPVFAVVDKAVEMIDGYHDQISHIEAQILVKPKPTTVRKLHIISGPLVYGLRRYDSDPLTKGKPIMGFMSHKSKIYLADVTDHAEYILSTLDMIAGIGESLTDYSFNVRASRVSGSMSPLVPQSTYSLGFRRLLTMITIICLPLTFVSGYFGMNFEDQPWTTAWTDVLFWIISLPLVAVISPLFIIPDIKRVYHYIRTRHLLKGLN
ncbi:hypothetical protein FB45DRAFT_945952 [Roridomyces roridus]|uniref:Uncharacterized protein n=1 Tax=Roridomyces roridus TaxID=1738132 RepID=A0AAD7B3N2_9AGAR|nr:hypothetical protein FB45DRAFT_945952 [Roridomyces roridus]